MKIGVVGLGRVGLPLALVLQEHGGHDVIGYDLDAARVEWRLRDFVDRGEVGLGQLIQDGGERLRLASSPEEVVTHAEVVFVVVQTLHGPGYGGDTPMPAEPADFDYTQLRAACDAIATAALTQRKPITVAVVSTVLPGTIRRELLPVTVVPAGRVYRSDEEMPLVRYVYNPALISLGSVVQDLLHPDFVLVGADDEDAAKQVAQAWVTVNGSPPFHFTSIASAELLKVTLNAYLSSKITFANTLAQLCHAVVGADVDEVTDGLKLSAKAMGPFGLTAGLGDGGPCRPRDLIALDWLARQVDDAVVNPFRFLARKREDHTRWLAELVTGLARDHRLPVVVLGLAYKPGGHLQDGSPARLLVHYLRQLGADPYPFDPISDGLDDGITWARSAVFVLATPHEEFLGWQYPPGSVVVDPHGVLKDQDGITVVRVGRR